MTYIELINRFWKIRRERTITAYESDLYFYLLKECNERNWVNPFNASTTVISAELGISRKSIADLRCRLKDKGLIDFREGKQGCCMPSYTIITKRSKPKPIPVEVPMAEIITPEEKVVKAKKKKCPKSLDELFKLEKPKKRAKKEFVPPTLEEVKRYFEDQGKGDQAELFFNHYESLGWRTGSGAQIQKWDSKANVWIIKDKKEEHKNETVRESKINNRDGNSEYKKKLTTEAEQNDRRFREEHGF